MPAPTKIYFPQIAVGWEDWVQIVNTSNEPAHLMAIARNQQGIRRQTWALFRHSQQRQEAQAG